MLSDEELLALAGKAAFSRGRQYHAQGRVRLTRHDREALEAEVQGSETYSLWMRHEGSQWRWSCSCPAADDGSFCKHLVAAALTARDDAAGDEAGGAQRAGAEDDELWAFLRAQPAERLAGWLKALADDDPEVEKRLRLFRAAETPGALKTALGKLLNTGGFLDYRGSLVYARRLATAVQLLETQLARDAVACRELCEHVIGRLLKIYERSDDSAGAIGERLHEFAALHARACAAAPPGKALAKSLFALQQKDGWGLLPLAHYWDALGPEGRAEYGRLVAAELAGLPAKPDETTRHGAAFRIRARAEAYARTSGDFDLLQRVLRWDLSQPHDHLRVLESLREFRREREALDWAERAVKRFPQDERLRAALAACLHAAGLDEEALEQCWQAFCLRPGGESWDRLKRAAGADWPRWRERALSAIAARENGEATLRVRLLQHDGDFAAAVALARECPVRPDTLQDLAQRLERDDPTTAGEFYLRLARLEAREPHYDRYPQLVHFLARAARLLPRETVQPELVELSVAHARKT